MSGLQCGAQGLQALVVWIYNLQGWRGACTAALHLLGTFQTSRLRCICHVCSNIVGAAAPADQAFSSSHSRAHGARWAQQQIAEAAPLDSARSQESSETHGLAADSYGWVADSWDL